MKSLFFLAVLTNLIFFLWQYQAGAFHQTADTPPVVNSAPKQILLVSELKNTTTTPVAIDVNRLIAPSLEFTAPLTTITPIEHNHQQWIISSVSDSVPPSTHVTVAENKEPVKLSEPALIATSEKTATLQTPTENLKVSENKASEPTAQSTPAATSEAITPVKVAEPTVTAAPKVTEPVETPSAKPVYCYQITGFTDKKTASHWAQKQGIDSVSFHIKETAPAVSDYIVNYPAATQADVKKNMETLKKLGISNFFMLHQGELKGAISLGIFKNEARAVKVQQDFIKQGIPAKVTKRYKSAASIAAHIKTEKNKSQLLKSLAGHTPKPGVQLLSQCE